MNSAPFNLRQSRKSEQQSRIKFYFIGAGALLLIIGLIYVILFSPVFKIRAFNISGGEHHTDKEIMDIISPLVLNTRVKIFLGQNNLLSWNIPRPDISKTALSEAVIDREWIRQSISISVRERERLAIWCDKNNDCNWIDGHGMAIEKAPQTEGSLIIAVYDISADRIIRGEPVLEDRFISNLISVIRGIAHMELPVKKITYDNGLQEIRVENYSGPDLFFSIRFDPAQNIASLLSLQEKTNTSRIGYIDLRVENRLYYK